MKLPLDSLWSFSTLSKLVDFLLVWYLFYLILTMVKDTRAVNLMKGLLAIGLIKFLSYALQLHTLDWIINLVIQWGVIALIIVFQPEIRRVLEHIGRTSLFTKKNISYSPLDRMIIEINQSVQYMAKRRIGALISIEMSNSLQEYIGTGIPIHGEISNQLLTNIFIPNTPLHDGAVVVRNYQIEAAACYLPLSENPLIPKELGTRHRAAIGLSEVTDAVTIVISEETGSVSLTYRHQILRDLSEEDFVNQLKFYLMREEVQEESQPTLWRKMTGVLKEGTRKHEK